MCFKHSTLTQNYCSPTFLSYSFPVYPMYDLVDRDLGARIGRLKTAHGTITTPTVLPVINPNRITVKPSEMEKLGAQALITNSYIIWKDKREEAIAQGVHNLIDFHGPIMTDSGAYQLLVYGGIDVLNQEIIDFQSQIGVDIGVILDHPTASTEKNDVQEAVHDTITAAKEASLPGNVLWSGPVQGTGFPALQKKCAQEMAELPFSVHPIGSIVPRMISYDFSTVIKAIINAKKYLPPERPVHAFGAGHPMFFALLAAAGADLFDSAAYALYAKEGRYMTTSGTVMLKDLKELPCSCPVCASHKPEELDEQLLALHNLHVTFQEIRTIRQAIRDKTLFELLEERCRAHPKLVPAMKALVSEKKYFDTVDWFPKKRVLELSNFTKQRPDVRKAIAKARPIKAGKVKLPLYGETPVTILDCYPFYQTEYQEDGPSLGRTPKGEQKVRAASAYWVGVDIFPKDITISRSRKTGRIRAVYDKEKNLLATFRASDFYMILHDAARTLHKKTKEHRVLLSDPEAAKLAKEGKTVFAKFVTKADPAITPGQQVLVTDEKDSLLCSGTAKMNAREMLSFKRGPAIETKWKNS